MIIYQVYPRSFKDSNNDGIGDLNGITEKLGYIADLGADTIWISPFFTSPMKDFGYDISDYCDIDPMFGTLHDFDRLSEEAHKRNLRILIDQVWGHCSEQHPWFRESRSSRDNPKHDWFVWADPKPDGTPPNNWFSIFGGPAWSWGAKRNQYYLHHFLAAQPAFNLRNEEAFEALMQAADFWIDRGVGGFRVDAVPTFLVDPSLKDNPPSGGQIQQSLFSSAPNPRFLQNNLYNQCVPDLIPLIEKIRTRLTQKNKDIFLLGEITKGGFEYLAECTHGDKRFHTGYQGGLTKTALSAADMNRMIAEAQHYFDDPGKVCWSMGNHDVTRAMTRVAGNENLWRVLVAWYFCLQGDLCWYQGDELGLTEADIPYDLLQDPYGKSFWPEYKGRDGCRTPFPWHAGSAHAGFTAAQQAWLPVAADHTLRALDQQQGMENSCYEWVRRLINLRNNHAALSQGGTKLLKDMPQDVVGFVRHIEDQKITALFNLSGKTEVTIPVETSGDALVSFQAYHEKNNVILPPESCWISLSA